MSSSYTKAVPVESTKNVIGGSFKPTDKKIAVVVARFNFESTDKLAEGARTALKKYEYDEERFDFVYVPGAFELPITAKKLALTTNYSSIICLGAVIKGDTSHYDYVCKAATDGILSVGLQTMVPIIFGVLTCDNIGQAFERVQDDDTNKGYEAVETAIWTSNVMKFIG